jgi:spore maturation protein CgeB
MKKNQFKIVVLGLTITSSWRNVHASTYRGLMYELVKRGHDVLFLEQNVPLYQRHQDLTHSPFFQIETYQDPDDLRHRFAANVREAEVIIIGSSIPHGAEIAEWILLESNATSIFLDLDTPLTLERLDQNNEEYISRNLIEKFSIYLSSMGGKVLELIKNEYGATTVHPFYFCVDPLLYFPQEAEKQWSLGYLGHYSQDIYPDLNLLMIEAAKNWTNGKFVVAGSQYPENLHWPHNIEKIGHLAPSAHSPFYNCQKFTLNLTREKSKQKGYSPSIRLFEAAACGIPVISDYSEGLENIFDIEKEILISTSCEDTLRILRDTKNTERQSIAKKAQARVLSKHTAAHRVTELENYVYDFTEAANLVS